MASNENIDYCINGNWVRAIFSALPAWFRFAQCFRRYKDQKDTVHLVNAGKYSSTLIVVIFSFLNVYFNLHFAYSEEYNPFFYLWIIAQVISSSYAYAWDIKKDWGLMDQNPGDNPLLREEMVYNSKIYYYFAILEDFVLRFRWSVGIALKETGNIPGSFSEWLSTLFSILEVIRRFIWNFFRLENEHLNNCGKFRAVRDISVAPIDNSDHADIIKMMDDPDGVNVVRKRKSAKKSGNKVAADLLKPLLENEQFTTLAANI